MVEDHNVGIFNAFVVVAGYKGARTIIEMMNKDGFSLRSQSKRKPVIDLRTVFLDH